MIERIKPLRGRNTVVLATGDPLNYGVARKLLESCPSPRSTIIPHLSAFSLAAARMRLAAARLRYADLARPRAANLEAFIQPGATAPRAHRRCATIAEVARRLVARGYGDS